MKIHSPPPQPPRRPPPAPLRPLAPDGPAPWGGWGFMTGGFAIWAGFILLRHLKVLGLNGALFSNLYDLHRYPGGITGGAWLLVWARHAWHLALAGALAAAALGYGLRALALLRLEFPVRGLRELLALAAGFSILGLGQLAGGLAGLWWWGWPAALTAVGCAFAWQRRASFRNLVPPPPGAAGLWPLAVVGGATALLIVAVALSPEVFYDSQVYHLADPFAWAKQHKITFLPWNFFSNFPFTFEMLFGAGLMFGHESVRSSRMRPSGSRRPAWRDARARGWAVPRARGPRRTRGVGPAGWPPSSA